MENSEELIWKYIEDNWVVSFTAQQVGKLWSANAFYLLDRESHSLLLLSSLESQHGKMLLENPHVSGTISNQTLEVNNLKGIQYLGKLEVLDTKIQNQALALYCEKFPIANGRKETVWRLSFTKIKYTDNSLGFGSKLYWDIDQ